MTIFQGYLSNFGIVQLGGCKEVMKLIKQKFLLPPQDSQLGTKYLKGCDDGCTQLPQSIFCEVLNKDRLQARKRQSINITSGVASHYF